MQKQANQNIIDSIMSKVDMWNFSPYKTQTGGSVDLLGGQAVMGSVPFIGRDEYAHNPFHNQMYGLESDFSSNMRELPVQSDTHKLGEKSSWWEKTKDFAGSGLGRSLIATGLTGALTAAFGGSPLEAVSYGVKSGGSAANIYSRNLKDSKWLKHRQEQLDQRAYDNEQNRQSRIEQSAVNAELRKSLADLAYQRALALNGQKNDYTIQTDERRQGYKQLNDWMQNQYALDRLNQEYDYRDAALEKRFEQEEKMAALRQNYNELNNWQKRNWQVQDRDLNYERQMYADDLDFERRNALNDKDFEYRLALSGIGFDHEIQKMAQNLDNQMKMAVLEGDIEKANTLYKMQLQLENEIQSALAKGEIQASLPTRSMKNDMYFKAKNRGVPQGFTNGKNVSPFLNQSTLVLPGQQVR